jgi:hypothetical protein
MPLIGDCDSPGEWLDILVAAQSIGLHLGQTGGSLEDLSGRGWRTKNAT